MKEPEFQSQEQAGIGIAEIAGLVLSGHSLFENGRMAEAKQIFEGLAVLDGGNPYVHGHLGAIYQKEKAFDLAIAHYTRALQVFPGDLCSLVNRGEIQLRQGKFAEAADDFHKAIELDPRGSDRFANRARMLVLTVQEALRLAKKAGS
ncbi:tetratricopeptide repeat protein [bacterium]|nr:tetratricopeptide repeat protein [bacterium]